MSLVALESLNCSACSVNALAIVSLKKWSAITIGCCCLLGVSGLGLSTYLLIKYLKLKRSLISLQTKLANLTSQLNVKETKSVLISQHQSRSKEKKSKNIQFKPNISVEYRDESSSSSVEGSYETPDELTSPVRTIQSRAFVTDKNKNFINNFDLNLNDNRSLELLQMQTLENKRLVFQNNQCKYNQNQNNLMDCVNYIKSIYVLSDFETDIETKKNLQYEAYNIAKECLIMHSYSYLSHKWFALTIGKIIDYMSINEKIKSGFEFKNHLDEAISLANDTDYLLFYLRGRWYFKMCSLSWAEKYGIRVMFGKIPETSFDDAYNDFLKVEQLHRHKSKGSILHLAKCLIKKQEIKKAIEYLKIAYELPIRTSEHQIDNQEILSLINKYS